MKKLLESAPDSSLALHTEKKEVRFMAEAACAGGAEGTAEIRFPDHGHFRGKEARAENLDACESDAAVREVLARQKSVQAQGFEVL
ncbi:MAG: hypothetical protein IJT05_04475 [Lachnospiraceae bacterium]|nr:hypothetical protein [Lachnospiraceae bacterium]